MAGSHEIDHLNSSETQSYQYIDERIDSFDIEPGTVIPPLRIVIMGKGPFADSALKALIEAGHEVVSVFGPAHAKGEPPDAVRLTAQGLNIPEYKFSSLKDPKTIQDLKDLKPDIIIGAYLTAEIEQEVAETALMGMYGFHPSLLPHHRGSSSIPWQIANGDTAIGMTMYAIGRDNEQIEPDETATKERSLPKGSLENHPNDKSDKGPILAQKSVQMYPGADTSSSAYSKEVSPRGVEFIVETVNKMSVKKSQGMIYRGTPQIKGSGSYQPPMVKEHLRIDWNLPAKEITATIRAGEYNPGAYTVLENGIWVTLYGSKVVEGNALKPGKLHTISDESVIIETGKNLVEVKSMRTGEMVEVDGKRIEKKGKPMKAPDFAKENGISTETILLSPNVTQKI